MALNWSSPPGGKRYTASAGGRRYTVVKQNTAAGAARWKTTVVRGGTTYVLAKTDSVAVAKRAAERDAASR